MYTTCPECGTTFRLGISDLRRAGGKVRCGECAHVFNAVEYLLEDETKHNNLLERLENIQRGMYPYG